MNNTSLHSTPEHASHDHDEDDYEEVPETPPPPRLNKSRGRPVFQLGLKVRRLQREKVMLPRMIMQSIWKILPAKVN
ncbi:hypothetical protein COP2_033420 [Malus domestica]